MVWSIANKVGIWSSLSLTLLLVGLSAYAWHRRSAPGAAPFAVGCVFAALWTVGATMEWLAADVSAKIFWVKFQAIWQVPSTTAIACFILEYAWPGRWLTRRNLALLSIAPLTFAVLIVTNDLHHLVWYGFTFDGMVTTLRAPANWFFVAYTYAMSVFEVAILVWLLVRWPEHRWLAGLMLTGQVVGRILYILEAVGIVHVELPLDVFVIGVMFVAYSAALFGFRILDPSAMARRSVVAQIRDGMLVLDTQQRIAGLNPAAQAMLGAPQKGALGRPIQDYLPAWPEMPPAALAVGATHTSTEMRLGAGRDAHDYVMDASALRDWRGMVIGYLLLLRDVTDQRQAQAQIVEQQRILATLAERERLARELHDSMGQTLAATRLRASTARLLLARGETAEADWCLEQITNLAATTEDDVREYLLGARTCLLVDLSLFQALREYVEQFRKHYGLPIDLNVPATIESAGLRPAIEMQLLRIAQESLSNIRKHARATKAQVTFALSGPMVQMTVSDDGQGFDPEAVVSRCAEGYGLQAMRERAEGLGGSLHVDSAPHQGTRVIVRVPAGDGAVRESPWPMGVRT